MRSLIDSLMDQIYASSVSSDNTTTQESPVADLTIKESPVDNLPAPSTDDVPNSSFADVTPVRSLTPANRSLRFLEVGAPGSPYTHIVSSRAAVPGMCISSTDLLSFIDHLPVVSPRRSCCSRLAVCWQGPVTCGRSSRPTRGSPERGRANAISGWPGCAPCHLCGCRGGSATSHDCQTFPRLTGSVRAVLDDYWVTFRILRPGSDVIYQDRAL